jgi:hypothetical protein
MAATSRKPAGFGDEKGGSTEQVEFLDEKKFNVNTIERVDSDSSHLSADEESYKKPPPPSSARDLVTEVLLVEDDPTLNPWTFRTFFVGIGVSIFAAYVYAILPPQSSYLQ